MKKKTYLKKVDKKKYKKYIKDMSSIALTGGVAYMIKESFPDYKEDCDKVQECMNSFVSNWNHIGEWRISKKKINKKIISWYEKYIYSKGTVTVADLLAVIIGILVDMLPTLSSYEENKNIKILLKTVENLLSNFDNETLEYDDDNLKISQNFLS